MNDSADYSQLSLISYAGQAIARRHFCMNVGLGNAPHLGGLIFSQIDSPVRICHKSCPKPKTSAASVPTDYVCIAIWSQMIPCLWYGGSQYDFQSEWDTHVYIHCSSASYKASWYDSRYMNVQHLQNIWWTHSGALGMCCSPCAPPILEPCSRWHFSASQSRAWQTDSHRRSVPVNRVQCMHREGK